MTGLVRRLRKIATHTSPREGQPGGPLPVVFGATFYPACALTADDLLRRAKVALQVAAKNANRLQLDGAEAPTMAGPENMREEENKDIQVAEPASMEYMSRPWIAEGTREPEQASLAVIEAGKPAPAPRELEETHRLSEDAAISTAVSDRPQWTDQVLEENIAQLLCSMRETLGVIRKLRAAPWALGPKESDSKDGQNGQLTHRHTAA